MHHQPVPSAPRAYPLPGTRIAGEAPTPPLEGSWTQHAHARLQQRGIPQRMADLLLDWGSYEPIKRQRDRVTLRRRDLQRLRAQLPKRQWLEVEKRRNLFAVVGHDGGVITIGHNNWHLVRV